MDTSLSGPTIFVSSSSSYSDTETLAGPSSTKSVPSQSGHEDSGKQSKLTLGGNSGRVKRAFKGSKLLNMREMYDASNINVYDRNGDPVRFGSLFQDQTTIVIFIRHFWCHMDQDYMQSISTHADSELIRRGGRRLVVIGCGSPAMIKPYCRMFRFPFEMYTDPSRRLYSALGMTLRTLRMGPSSEKGEYIKHGFVSGTAKAVKNNVKNMPLHILLKKGGHLGQLGGEFVLGPGLQCDYAHRMHTPRSHASIREVIAASGLSLNDIPQESQSVTMADSEKDQWIRDREAELREIWERRCLRRWNIDIPIDVAYGLIDSHHQDQAATPDGEEEETRLRVRRELLLDTQSPSFHGFDELMICTEDDCFVLNLEDDDFDRFSCDGGSSVDGRSPRSDE
ncbi:hypothetical protein FRC02_001152 [Tulasnella sp. 418]|nr:hypothetical protein FRC02_001152 [Tulasnella sp. 418]